MRKLSPAQRLWRAVFRDPDPPTLDGRRVLALVQGLLDARQRRAVELRFGLKDGRSRSLAEVGRHLPRADGKDMGVSREIARRELAVAVRRLRHSSRRALWRAAVQQQDRGDATCSGCG